MTQIDLSGMSDREILILAVQEINNLTERFGNLDGKDGVCKAHDRRLRDVESWKSKFAGALVLAMFVIPIIVTLSVKAFIRP